MSEDDRLLRIVGIVLVAFIVIAVTVGVLAAMNSGGDTPGPGDTEWSIDRLNETHVEVTYDDGPPMPSDEVVVSVDGYTRAVVWSGPIQEGVTGVLRAAPDRVVRVYWTDGRGPRVQLAIWQV